MPVAMAYEILPSPLEECSSTNVCKSFSYDYISLAISQSVPKCNIPSKNATSLIPENMFLCQTTIRAANCQC